MALSCEGGVAITTTLPTIVAGADYAVTVTISNNGASYNTSGHTITGTCVDGKNHHTKFLAGIAITNRGGTSDNASIILTDNQTALLRTLADPRRSLVHVLDLKVVESGGDILFSSRFEVPVRRGPSSP
jgi:hypothetical protein